MNEFLADLYGTRSNIGAPEDTSDDVEKLAEAQMLDQFLTNEGVDVDQLDGDTILKVAYDLFGEESEIVKSAMEDKDEDDDDDDEEDENEEKLAEADFLGRVMAHSFVDEQNAMEKDAASFSGAWKATKGFAGKAGKKISKGGKYIGGKAKATGKWAKEPGSTFTEGRKLRHLSGGKGKTKLREIGATLKDVGQTAMAHKGQSAAALGGIGALTAGGVALSRKGKKKKSSALDALAEERALEIMKEAGILDSAPEEKLAASVEERAWELLYENGLVED